MPLSYRQTIYRIFCESYNFYKQKNKNSNIEKIRKLIEQQVHLILCNFEFKILTKKKMAKLINVKSTYTLDCIKKV